MRMLRLLVLLAIGVGVTPAQQPPKTFSASDPYSLDFVRSALQYFKNGGFGFEGKRIAWGTVDSPGLNQFGDRVSIALLKIYSREELSQPENGSRCLTAIFVDKIQTGMTHVNSPTVGGEAHVPFGGTKATSVGPKEVGNTALDFYTDLKIVRTAFENRSSVLEPSDRDPRITLFLLDYLQEKGQSDVTLEKRIEYIRGCIKEFTCSPQD